MALRPSALESVDPLRVPLPHGTEVTTRVPRQVGDRLLPAGLVGRVVREHGGGVDVHVTGAGDVRYARDEVVPRRLGQLAFAVRREAAWDALWPCRVLEATVGSRAWGLATEGSDVDLRGAFALPFPWTQGLVEPPDALVSADGSQTYWALKKTVEQGLRADPNTLELLFVPSVRPLDELGQWLLDVRGAFVSTLLFGSFGRYALSQLDKLVRSQRLAQHREAVLDWLRAEPGLTLDAVAARLAARSPRPASTPAQVQLAAKEYLKQLCRSLADQGLLAVADLDSLRRYALDGGAVPAEARELRPKNAYNLLRLVALATTWLRDGTPTFEVQGPLRDRLLEIKAGTVPLDDVLAEAEALSPALEQARDQSRLPDGPDVAAAHAFLQRAGDELARRWLGRAPGPWGRDAPSAPTPPPRGA